jgi:hypothetical protein
MFYHLIKHDEHCKTVVTTELSLGVRTFTKKFVSTYEEEMLRKIKLKRRQNFANHTTAVIKN